MRIQVLEVVPADPRAGGVPGAATGRATSQKSQQVRRVRLVRGSRSALCMLSLAIGCQPLKPGTDRAALDEPTGTTGQAGTSGALGSNARGSAAGVSSGGTMDFRSVPTNGGVRNAGAGGWSSADAGTTAFSGASGAGSVTASSQTQNGGQVPGTGGSPNVQTGGAAMDLPGGIGGTDPIRSSTSGAGAGGTSTSVQSSLAGQPIGAAGLTASAGANAGGTSSNSSSSIAGQAGVAGGSDTIDCSATDNSLAEPDELHVDDLPDDGDGQTVAIKSSAKTWPTWLNVCFDASGDELDAAAKDLIRQTVLEGWGRPATTHFLFGENCDKIPSVPIQVLVRRNSKLGPEIRGAVSSVGPPDAPPTIVSFREAKPSTRTILHLFGHVLGFRHPQPAAPCNAIGAACIEDIPTEVAPTSVMSQTRCQATKGASPWDVVAIQGAYGRHVSGALVGTNAQCLDIPMPLEYDCDPLQVYACHGGTNQQWRMNEYGYIVAHSEYYEWVADIYYSIRDNGNGVLLCKPHEKPAANQQWFFQDAEIRGIGDLCIGGSESIRTQLCNGSEYQRWHVIWRGTSDISFQTVGATYSCLQAPAPAGSPMTMAPCSDDARQIFRITPLGEITIDGKCWSSEQGDLRVGRTILLEDCVANDTNKRHQQFHLRGQVKSGLDTCLSTPVPDNQSKDRALSMACSRRPDSLWDYYFNP